MAAVAVATAVSGAWLSPVAAETGQAPPAQLSVGGWFGVASADGTATATEQGVTFVLDVDIDVELALHVTRDGAVTGDWTFEAPVRMDGEGLAEGRSFSMRWRGPVTGTGTITGSPTRLTMVGTQTSGGTVTVEVAGQDFTTTVDEQNPSPPLEVEVAESTCDEVFGDWVFGLDAAFTEAGWRPQIEGTWFAWRDTSEDGARFTERGELGRTFRRLVDDINQLGVDEGLTTDPVEGVGPANPFTDIGARVLDLAARVVAFHNSLRNLAACEAARYSVDELERFFTVGSEVMAGLIVVADQYDISVSTIRTLMDAGLQVGAVGAGATHPRAAELEGLLQDHADAILHDWLDDGKTPSRDGPPQPEQGCSVAHPCIILSPEAIDVLTAGAAYGWSFQLGESERAAVELLAGITADEVVDQASR